MNHSSRKTLTAGIVAGMLGLSLSCSSAVVLFADDFEADTIGQNPSGWTITDNPPTGPDISVVAGSSTGGDAPNEKLLNFNSNNTTETYRASHGFTSTNTGIVELSFSMRFNLVATESNPIVQLTGFSSAAYIGARSNATTGSNAGFYYYSNGGGPFSILSNIIESDWYRVSLQVNLDTDRWSFRVDNLNNAAANQHAYVSDLLFWGSTSYLSSFKFERSSFGGNFDIDDVVVQTVPEPATTGLLLGGAAMLFGAVWRKRR